MVGEIFIPSEEVTRSKGGKQRVVTQKYFPGYLLLHMDLQEDLWHLIIKTNRVTGFVGVSITESRYIPPIPLSNEELMAIKEQIDSGFQQASVEEEFVREQKVMITKAFQQLQWCDRRDQPRTWQAQGACQYFWPPHSCRSRFRQGGQGLNSRSWEFYPTLTTPTGFMAKEVKAFIKLQVAAGKANPSPPIGPALGQHGVNIMEFCKAFNARTQGLDTIIQS